MEGLLVYYPLIFVFFFFVSGCVICYKCGKQRNYIRQKERNRKQSQYNLDRLMNNHNHCVSEEQIVVNLRQYDIQYYP